MLGFFFYYCLIKKFRLFIVELYSSTKVIGYVLELPPSIAEINRCRDMIIKGGFLTMGTKRVGLARIEALMENMKRQLNMSGSTWCGEVGGCHGSFGAPPLVLDDDSTVADGADNAIVIHQYSDGLRLHVQNLHEGGTNGQTILIPAASTSGMDYSYDAADNEGIQWVASMNTHKGYPGVDRFTVGTHGAFYMEMEFELTDVSDADTVAFGFRKVEAFQPEDVDAYDEAAFLNCISGDIYTGTILNNAGTTSTDTTDNWGDTESHTFRVNVSSTGVVTFKIDGVAPTVTQAFTFDDGEVVTPFGYHAHAAASTVGIIYKKVKWGLQGFGNR
jgi:hypothetical protein